MPTTDQTIGYEMEYSGRRITQDQISDCLSAALSDEDERFINALRDRFPSGYSTYVLKSEHCGYETTSPVFSGSRSSLLKLRKTLSRINREFRNRHITNPCETLSCGLHVHIDRGNLSGITRLNIIRMVYVYEDVLLRLFGRTNNSYVSHLRSHFSSLSRVQEQGAHGSIRQKTHGNAQTFEFRHAHGMNDTNKTIAWIYLIYLMVEIAKSFGTDVPMYTRDIFNHPTNEKFVRFIMAKSKNITGKPWLKAVAETALQKVGLI